ncbi:DUF3077 domain-containing protein [Pseudomonas soli]|jgi:hypothetical protein|nr:DUF3077 domain-containing protein [Pseudomonas soli]
MGAEVAIAQVTGIMEEKLQLLWASYYLSALAKALMDDAELGMGC